MADKDADEKPKSKKKLMMIGAVVAAGAAYKFVLAPPPAEPAAAAGSAEATPIPEGEVIAIEEELVVNLAADSGEGLHYARVGVAAVLKEGADPHAVEAHLPLINDVVIDIVSKMTFEELREPGAITHLKDEISEEAAHAFHGGEVVRVVFTTFVMQ